MTEETKYCEYFVVNDPDHRVKCGRPAHRVSEGQHYCREHFEAVIDEAKTDVVNAAVKVPQMPRAIWKNAAYRELSGAITRLKGLGWEPTT